MSIEHIESLPESIQGNLNNKTEIPQNREKLSTRRVSKDRYILSEGMENTVLRPVSQKKPSIVLKVSRPFNYLSMLGRDQAKVLRKELIDAQALVKGTDVKIPRTIILGGQETHVLGIKTKGYVIGQKYIEEDGTVPDIKNHLANQSLSTLVDEYKHEPRNFISKGGTVYWIDPTKGTTGRILEDTKLMKLETYRNVRQKLHKVIRFFGL